MIWFLLDSVAVLLLAGCATSSTRDVVTAPVRAVTAVGAIGSAVRSDDQPTVAAFDGGSGRESEEPR
jgi:uncharacterized lipoprotein YajG